jgi:hypothetical protein
MVVRLFGRVILVNLTHRHLGKETADVLLTQNGF